MARVVSCLAIAAALMASPPLSAAEVPIEVLAGPCAACHGTDGRSPGGMPTLAGKSEETLLKSLKGFKSGEAPATVMTRLAKGYSDAQLQALARHFSQFK